MYKVLLVIHVMTTLALIAIVLVQRSSSDGMGLSGSSSSNNFLSGRAAANFASRSTALLALIFMLTSLSLGVITTHNHVANGSIADKIKAMPVKQTIPSATSDPLAPTPTTPKTAGTSTNAPASDPAPVAPAKPAAAPSVPRPE